MDEFVQPSVITAIADAEFEGMVSSALYESGWSVIARPLDFATLAKSLNEAATKNVLVIYSVDLPGLTNAQLQKLSPVDTSLFGFADAAGSARGFSEISQRPTCPEELLAYIRGNIRSPLLRVPLLQSKQKFKAKIIGIGSAGHYTGATTLALNIAQELALLDKKTLLIDANFQASAIATVLDLRKIADEDRWRDLSDNFSVYAFDTPGYGNSTPPNKPLKIEEYASILVDAIDKLDIKKYATGGCHTGASLALEVINLKGQDDAVFCVLNGVPYFSSEEREEEKRKKR